MTKQHIGIFGGTFDPIHNGHIKLAASFLEKLHLDEVWFLVTLQNPWKQNSSLSPDDVRFQMVQKALEGHEGLVASDYEFHLDKPSYSYQTLRHLREDFPDKEFILLIGADNWVKFNNWAEYEEILANHSIAVYPRKGYEVDENTMPQNVQFVKTRLYNVSSTEIRERISKGQSIAGMVPKEIVELVKTRYTDR